VYKMYYIIPSTWPFTSHYLSTISISFTLFNTHVSLGSANVMSLGEYIIAYLVPFVTPLLFCQTQVVSLKIAINIVSLTNLMVHTPKLETLYMKRVPEFLVSTNNHLDHHHKLRVHYASSIINVDNIIRYFTPKIMRPKRVERLLVAFSLWWRVLLSSTDLLNIAVFVSKCCCFLFGL
jgi:hypothetical protein